MWNGQPISSLTVHIIKFRPFYSYEAVGEETQKLLPTTALQQLYILYIVYIESPEALFDEMEPKEV